MINEKSVSKDQQRIMGMAYAVRIGELSRDKVSDSVLKIVDGDISNSDLLDFAKTKHKGLPEKVKPVKETLCEYLRRTEII